MRSIKAFLLLAAVATASAGDYYGHGGGLHGYGHGHHGGVTAHHFDHRVFHHGKI